MDKEQAELFAMMLNSRKIKKHLGIRIPFRVQPEDIFSAWDETPSTRPTINQAQIIAALKAFCKGAMLCCPYIIGK